MCVFLVASVWANEASEVQTVYPSAYGAPLTYTVPAPIQYKYVPKEVDIEIKPFRQLRVFDPCMYKCAETCENPKSIKCSSKCRSWCA